MNELEKLMQQHVENYKKAVLEIVNNNTNSLIDNDIIFFHGDEVISLHSIPT